MDKTEKKRGRTEKERASQRDKIKDIIFNLKQFIEWKDISYIHEIFRMPFARIIDKINKNICWAKLVYWALGFEPFLYVFARGNWGMDCTEETGAYCGKCIETGRLSW